MKIRLFTLPNLLTLCNLLSGCAAVLIALTDGSLCWVFWCVAAAAGFDFFDGFVARLMGSHSEIGKELDSLADMVSFGVAPSAVLYMMSLEAGSSDVWSFGVFVVAAFSALRLAKFNIDPTQHHDFEGLPTPACALFFVSVGYMTECGWVLPLWSLGAAAVLFSLLLIAPIRMFALKFTHYGFRENRVRYLFLAASALGVAWFGIAALPFVILTYVVVSTVRHVVGASSAC